MRSQTTKEFRALLAALPESVQRQARVAYRLFRDDPFHPSLRFKPVSQRDPTIFSARVGLRYRAIGIRRADRVVWTWIGSHADYDAEIERHDD